jgi:hypothetical protein
VTAAGFRRPTRELIGAILGVAIAAFGAAALIGKVRAVDVVALFAGGFASGAGFVSALAKYRAARKGAA